MLQSHEQIRNYVLLFVDQSRQCHLSIWAPDDATCDMTQITPFFKMWFLFFKTISILLPGNMNMLYKPQEVPQGERI